MALEVFIPIDVLCGVLQGVWIHQWRSFQEHNPQPLCRFEKYHLMSNIHIQNWCEKKGV